MAKETINGKERDSDVSEKYSACFVKKNQVTIALKVIVSVLIVFVLVLGGYVYLQQRDRVEEKFGEMARQGVGEKAGMMSEKGVLSGKNDVEEDVVHERRETKRNFNHRACLLIRIL